MPQSRIPAYVLSALVVVVLAAGGFWLVRRTEPPACAICHRGVSAQSRAIVELAGRRAEVCCVRCAFTYEEQKQSALRLLDVTDYPTQKAMKPEDAWYVVGSRVVLCVGHDHHMDEQKQPLERVFDRCEPSIYAFASREDAEAFSNENGGTLRRLPALAPVVQRAPGSRP